MISSQTAALILDQSVPFVMHENTKHPVGADFWCISPDQLKALGVSEADLSDYAGGMYCGKDHLFGRQEVHVFQRSLLESFMGVASTRKAEEAILLTQHPPLH